MSRPRRVLVTGGQGQLGWELRRLLSTRDSAQGGGGAEAWAPGRDDLDVTGRRAVERALEAYRPDLVIHGAAFTRVDACETEQETAFRVNAEATGHLAQLCASRGIPLVYISTDYVFDGDQRRPYEVTDPPRPLSVYGLSKHRGEVAVQEAGGPHWIVRTSWVYGMQGGNFPKAILRAAAEGRPLRVVDDQQGAPTYARDLAEVVLQLAGVRGGGTDSTGPAGPAPYGLYHASNRGSCTWWQFACEILSQAGWSGVEVAAISSGELGRPAKRPAYSVLSLASLEKVGIETRPWQEALGEFLQELREVSPELFPAG